MTLRTLCVMAAISLTVATGAHAQGIKTVKPGVLTVASELGPDHLAAVNPGLHPPAHRNGVDHGKTPARHGFEVFSDERTALRSYR